MKKRSQKSINIIFCLSQINTDNACFLTKSLQKSLYFVFKVIIIVNLGNQCNQDNQCNQGNQGTQVNQGNITYHKSKLSTNLGRS